MAVAHVLIWQPAGLGMIRLQWWESGPYLAAFRLRIPDMRSFLYLREIVKICSLARHFAIEHLISTGG